MRTAGLLQSTAAAVALSVVGCGATAPLEVDSGTTVDGAVDAAGSILDSTASFGDGESSQRDGEPALGDDAAGGAPFDAGYYYGDGSYFVDGGVYPDVGTVRSAGPDSGTGSASDASSSCGALSACCMSLSSSMQLLCSTIAGLGDSTHCTTQLDELEAAGECTGVSTLAAEIQVTPTWLVSDGTTLFWITDGTPALLAMPVGGGAITILLSGPIAGNFTPFLAVDDVNVYVIENYDLVRIPKNGAPATLISDAGNEVSTATVLGTRAYWAESVPSGEALKSAPLKGGPATVLGRFSPSTAGGGGVIGVTASTIFLGPPPLHSLPISGLTASGFQTVAATSGSCDFLTSDTAAVYCGGQTSGSNLRIASNGTVTNLGAAVSSSYIVYDDTYVYWSDDTTVGTITKAPKAGGGTATVIARDASPTAIAVDGTAVYWSDEAGEIKSVPK